MPQLNSWPRAALVACAVFGLAVSLAADPAKPSTGKPKPVIEEQDRVTVEVARDRARMMHEIYSSTLDVIHDRYFHDDKSAIPARAMEDVFREMNARSKSDARWIAVNLRAMSIDHEPETDFEKQAARELASGKSEFEKIEDGYLRRATPIPLTGGCISCHEGGFKPPTKVAKFAGLVISIPVRSMSP
jgi:hypothetical protein